MALIYSAARRLGYVSVGSSALNEGEAGVISILKTRPGHPVSFPYLVSGEAGDGADIVTLNHRGLKEYGRRPSNLSGLGFQMLIRDARGDGKRVAEWVRNAAFTARQCESLGCQFIVSSGARSVWELVPGPSMDAILRICGIEPFSYWLKLSRWIESKIAGQVTV